MYTWFMPHDEVLQRLQEDKRILNIKQHHDSESSVVALQNDRRLAGKLTINTARDIILCTDSSGMEYQFYFLGKTPMLVGVVMIKQCATEQESKKLTDGLMAQSKKLYKKTSETIFEKSVAFEQRCVKNMSIQKICILRTPDNKVQVRYWSIPLKN